MIEELRRPQYGRVLSLFEGVRHHVPALAVLDCNFPGRVFVDDPNEPRVAVVWALTRWAYISGDASPSDFTRMLPDLMETSIIPDSRQMGQTWFELYCPDTSAWTACVESVLNAYKPEGHYELLLTLDPSRFPSSGALHPGPEVRVKRVQIPIIPQRARDSSLIEEEFRARTAVGFACHVKGSIVAICRSNGLAAGREFMVDVETPDPAHRGKGYAKLASHALVEDSIRRGYSPLWETVVDNRPSLHLARGLGFTEQERYPVYAIEF